MRVNQRVVLATILSCVLALGVACSDDDEATPDSVVQADGGPEADGAVEADGMSQPDTGAQGECNASMGPSDACGGDLVGNWSYVEACADPDVVMGAIKVVCPTASGSNFDISTSQTAKLNFTATDYDLEVKTDVAFDLNVPVICATTLGGCATVQGLVESGFTTSGLEGTVSCTDNGGACDCAMAFAYDIQDAGTYTTADGIATLDNGFEYYYCVADGKLKYSPVPDMADDAAAGYVLSPAQ